MTQNEAFVVLTTGLVGVTLRAVTPDEAPVVRTLLRENRDHLTSNGDFADEVTASEATLRERFDQDRARPLAFAIVDREVVVGSVELVAVDPPRYGLGYWLAEAATGRGVATAAVIAITAYAAELGASDVFAGVTHGNTASVAVLHRAGFEHAAEFDTYTRFHRRLL